MGLQWTALVLRALVAPVFLVGNNHEGNWEHITVSVPTEEHASGTARTPSGAAC